MKSEKTRFMHLRLGQGYVTAAIRPEGVGLAWCNPGDQWDRGRGRMIAEGRLRAGKSFTPGTTDKVEIAQRIELFCRESCLAPFWAWGLVPERVPC